MGYSFYGYKMFANIVIMGHCRTNDFDLPRFSMLLSLKFHKYSCPYTKFELGIVCFANTEASPFDDYGLLLIIRQLSIIELHLWPLRIYGHSQREVMTYEEGSR